MENDKYNFIIPGRTAESSAEQDQEEKEPFVPEIWAEEALKMAEQSPLLNRGTGAVPPKLEAAVNKVIEAFKKFSETFKKGTKGLASGGIISSEKQTPIWLTTCSYPLGEFGKKLLEDAAHERKYQSELTKDGIISSKDHDPVEIKEIAKQIKKEIAATNAKLVVPSPDSHLKRAWDAIGSGKVPYRATDGLGERMEKEMARAWAKEYKKALEDQTPDRRKEKIGTHRKTLFDRMPAKIRLTPEDLKHEFFQTFYGSLTLAKFHRMKFFWINKDRTSGITNDEPSGKRYRFNPDKHKMTKDKLLGLLDEGFEWFEIQND